jgi:hypothetical protein
MTQDRVLGMVLEAILMFFAIVYILFPNRRWNYPYAFRAKLPSYNPRILGT